MVKAITTVTLARLSLQETIKHIFATLATQDQLQKPLTTTEEADINILIHHPFHTTFLSLAKTKDKRDAQDSLCQQYIKSHLTQYIWTLPLLTALRG